MQFNPPALGASQLMHDMRLAAVGFIATTHVVAVYRSEMPIRGVVHFRKYDNDSPARRRGTYDLVPASELWLNAAVTALTPRGSALHQAVEARRAAQRAAPAVNLIDSPPRR